MFRKLVSNLPFSPALVGQIGFYARRLRKEETTRRIGLFMTAFALIVQSFTVFVPSTSANGTDTNDMCPGITRDAAGVSKIKSCYNNDTRHFKAIMNYFGISKTELWNALDSAGAWRYTTTYGEWYTFGHESRSVDVKDYSGAVPGTLYARKWKNTITTRQWGWKGQSGETSFIILADCGNLALARLLKPIVKCVSLTASKQDLIVGESTTLTAKGFVDDGAVISSYNFTQDGPGTTDTTNTVATSSLSATWARTLTVAGKYLFNVKINTTNNKDDVTSSTCAIEVNVAEKPTPQTPHISLTKTVGENHAETLEVQKDGSFIYTIVAKNDGQVDLKDVVVSDTAQSGIQFISAKAGTTTIPVDGNKISYTIPTLAVGQSATIVITAKSTAVTVSPVVNKACVETPTIPATNPDACDTASTTTPEVPGVKTPHVKIEKYVHDAAAVTTQDLRETMTVNLNEAFIYQLYVTNDGQVDLSNVVVDDPAQSGIQFVSARDVTSNVEIPVTGNKIAYTIPSLAVGKTVYITITAKATVSSTTPVVNTACVNAPAVNPSDPTKTDDCDTASTTTPAPKQIQVCDPTTGNIITVNESEASKYEPVSSTKCKTCTTDPSLPGCSSDIELAKTAINKTQNNKDATSTKANGGDVIVFTITASNEGKVAGTLTAEDKITDILEYATLTDNGGAVYNADTKTLSWKDIVVNPGSSVTRTFTVTVKNPVPAMAQNQGTPDSYDCVMSNVVRKDGAGIVNIPVGCPAAKVVVEQTIVKQLPATGPAENMIFAGALLTIVTFFWARSRQLGTEIRLVRKDFSASTI